MKNLAVGFYRVAILLTLPFLFACTNSPSESETPVVESERSPASTKSNHDSALDVAEYDKTKTPENSVSIKLRLSEREKKVLNNSIPRKIRNLLENADELVILGDYERKDGKLVYREKEGGIRPNFRTFDLDKSVRKTILLGFYRDVARGSPPANCYTPHHLIRAKRGEEFAELEICFSCSSFRGTSSLGAFSGTTGRGDDRTEELFNDVLRKEGIEFSPVDK